MAYGLSDVNFEKNNILETIKEAILNFNKEMEKNCYHVITIDMVKAFDKVTIEMLKKYQKIT